MAPEVQAAIIGGIFMLQSTLHQPEAKPPRKEPQTKAKRPSNEKFSFMKTLMVFLIVGVFLITLITLGVSLTPTSRYTENSDGTLTDNQTGQVINRYTDNSNGTVTDNRTGLIWLKNANCFGEQNWQTAMQSAANLADGQCGLRDGSKAGDWRLPTLDMWQAMVDQRYEVPALSNAAGTGQWQEGHVFLGVKSSWYWSSSTRTYFTRFAWAMSLDDGYVNRSLKVSTYYMWPVRILQ